MGLLRKLFHKDTTTDVTELLAAQHKEVDDLIATLAESTGDRRALVTELADKLAAHAKIEEKIFYPAVLSKGTADLVHESVEEHLVIKRTLADLLDMNLDPASFKAKVSVLKEAVGHHAHDEEEKLLFPEVKAMFDADERAAIGGECLAMFEDLMAHSPSKSLASETGAAAPLPPTPRA